MMTRHRLVRKAKEAVLHAGQYAYVGRKDRKSQMRRDWIMHIDMALRPHNLKYSVFTHQLKLANIELDRKILAQIATRQPDIFKAIIEKSK